MPNSTGLEDIEIQPTPVEAVAQIEPPPWCEIHCFQCHKLIGKITAYAIQEGIQHVVKDCTENWCRHCKVFTYKLIVI